MNVHLFAVGLWWHVVSHCCYAAQRLRISRRASITLNLRQRGRLSYHHELRSTTKASADGCMRLLGRSEEILVPALTQVFSGSFEAQYPACTYPCQRFADAVTVTCA